RKEGAIVRQLEQGRGSQWDPGLVDVTLRLIRDGIVCFRPAGLEIMEPCAAAPAGAGHAVLLVEDDPAHALLARRSLEAAFEHVLVRHTSSAAAAIDLCRGSTWSLVVVDQTLPDASGLEL